jgi:flagellar biosynthetic protein FliQ
LTFVPKIVAVFVTMMIFGSWMLDNIVDFFVELCNNINLYIG